MGHIPNNAQMNLVVGDNIWFVHHHFVQLGDGTSEPRITAHPQSITRVTPTFVFWAPNRYREAKVRREEAHVSMKAALAYALIEAGQLLINEQAHHENMMEFRRDDIAACKRALAELENA